MTLSANVSGTWKNIQTVSVNVGGTWKNADSVSVNVSGTWKEVWTGENGNDDYTVLLLHGDGADASTVITDSSRAGKSITVGNNAQVDTAQSVFGGASILFDGTNDYVYAADSADFFFDTGDFTIDFRVMFAALPSASGYMAIFAQGADSNNVQRLLVYNDAGQYSWRLVNQTGGVNSIEVHKNATLTTNTWYHVAVVRNGNDFKIFQDGTQVGTTVTDASGMDDHSGNFYVGIYNDGASFDLNGWIDEFRVSKGIARWTADFTAPAAAYGGTYGNDSYTKLLLHGNGGDGSTVIADSSTSGKAVTTAGNVQIDTAQSKFGGASVLFDGTGDYLSCADSADWYFGTDPFTVDFWVRFNALPTDGNYMCPIQQRADADNRWFCSFLNTSGTYQMQVYNRVTASTTIDLTFSFNAVSTGTWYHIAIVRSGNDFYVFKDGTMTADSPQTDDSGMSNFAGTLYIGTNGASGAYMNGWIDELRVSKGIARWAANFTPPTKAYS